MIAKNFKRNLVSLVVVMLAVTSAHASLVVYEGFDYTVGDPVMGLAGGEGWDADGSWQGTSSDDRGTPTVGEGLTFGTLPVVGGSYMRPQRYGTAFVSRPISAASQAALTADGTTMWFSVLMTRIVGGTSGFAANTHGAIVFGDAAFTTANPGYAPPTIEAGGSAIGVSYDGDTGNASENWINGVTYQGGTLTAGTEDRIQVDGDTVMIVGKIEWAPNGSNDTLTLYKMIDPDVELPAPFTTMTVDVDQSNFNLVNIGQGQTEIFDEIRFGNSLGDVIGKPEPEVIAQSPVPGDKAKDVLRDSVVLQWSAGSEAKEHDIYLGTSFEDVNSATPTSDTYQRTLPADVTQLELGRLDLGVTYYWRVDAVNDLNSDSPWKGNVWSFTVEPKAIFLEAAKISVRPSSIGTDSQGNPLDTNDVINGAGLDEDGLHDVDIANMWKALPFELDPTPSIDFVFDKAYRLAEMRVWNHNSVGELSNDGYSIKDVNVYYLDGTEWIKLAGITQFAQAPGTPGYAGELFPLNIVTSGIRIEAVSPYATITIPGVGTFPKYQYGLSEVAFGVIPNTVREMSPPDGTADVDPTSALLSWRSGREAASHNVYLSTDEQAVIDRTATMASRIEPNIVPEVDLAQTYYWCVDEVNDLEDPKVWEGPVQNFRTAEYISYDEFEDYTDTWGNMVFQRWTDGLGWEDPDGNTGPSNGSGSGVGYWPAPTMESTIARSGQSMPFAYGMENQTDSYATLDKPMLVRYGIKSLSLWFYGGADNAGGQLYVKVNSKRYDYTGPAADIQTAQWFPFTIDLSGVTKIDSLTIGVQGGSGLIFVDEIRLYPVAAETYSPVVPSNNDPNLVAHYEFEGNVNDRLGNYPGIATGDPVYVAGKFGQALAIDGTDDQVVNTFAEEVVWSAYSVSLWARTEIFGQAAFSGLFNNNSLGADFQLDVDGADNYRYLGGTSLAFGPVTMDWVHLTATCDGTQTRLYYNGRYVGTVNDARLVFGQIAVGINRGMNLRFAGTIDDVRVFNRAVSHAEAAGLAGLTDTLVKPIE